MMRSENTLQKNDWLQLPVFVVTDSLICVVSPCVQLYKPVDLIIQYLIWDVLTHPRVFLGAIRYDFYVISIHIVTEEIIEVRLWPLTTKHVEAAVPLAKKQK